MLSLSPDSALDFEAGEVVDLEVVATDAAGATRAERLEVRVLDANDAPVAASSPFPHTLAPGEPYLVPESAFTDADDDTLVYRATLVDGSELPEWLVFDSGRPAFDVVASEERSDAADSVVVRLFADDGRGGVASIDLELRPAPTAAPALPEPVAVVAPASVPRPSSAPVPASVAETPEPAREEAPLAEPSPDRTSGVVSAAKVALDVDTRDTFGVETVDLQALIDDAPSVGTARLASAAAFTEPLPLVGREAVDGEMAIEPIDLASLLGDADRTARRALVDLGDVFESQREELEERAALTQALLGSSVGITSGLSVGYLIWLIRGGTLMGSVMSSLPAWRFVDPLPVLGSLAHDGAAASSDADDESLETLVERDAPAATATSGGSAALAGDTSESPPGPSPDSSSRPAPGTSSPG